MHVSSSWEAAGQETGLPPGYAAEMLKVIHQQIAKKNRMVRFRWMTAAASLLVLVVAVWLLKSETRPVKQTLATTVIPPAVDSGSWKQHTNTSAKAQRLRLPDGSVVTLAPETVIKYQEPFEANKRTVYIEGKADFAVTHDKTRPFTVYARLFSTTVLGTSFRVSENAAGCSIKLFTGKVLIKSLVDSLRGWKQDLVLLPGNQLTYNLAKGTVSVEQFNTITKPDPFSKNDVAASKDAGKIVFDNTQLPEVMKVLIRKYHTPITYNDDLLTGKYFSGEVLPGDSLSVILKVIANMNGLQVAEKDNGYIITKSK